MRTVDCQVSGTARATFYVSSHCGLVCISLCTITWQVVQVSQPCATQTPLRGAPQSAEMSPCGTWLYSSHSWPLTHKWLYLLISYALSILIPQQLEVRSKWGGITPIQQIGKTNDLFKVLQLVRTQSEKTTSLKVKACSLPGQNLKTSHVKNCTDQFKEGSPVVPRAKGWTIWHSW